MEALPIRVSELSIAGTEYAKIQTKIQTAESLAERLTECLAIVRHELLAELPLPRLAALAPNFKLTHQGIRSIKMNLPGLLFPQDVARLSGLNLAPAGSW